jgi:anti-sigma factor RsiW
VSCLGERLTALVDGELGHEERDRALAHLARCDQCRDEVASLREIKGRLRGLSEQQSRDDSGTSTDDLPSLDFLTRLRALPAVTGSVAAGDTVPDALPLAGVPAASSTLPTRPLARRAPRVSTVRPRDSRPVGRAAVLHVHPRRRYLVVGAATLFLGLGAASYVAGGSDNAPPVSPAFDRFAVEHALTSGDAPVTDPLTDPVNQVQVSPGP